MILLGLALLIASPTTLPAQMKAARPGDVVRLDQGLYPELTLKSVRWAPAVTIDARAATLNGVKFTDVEGVILRGPEILGKPVQLDAKGVALTHLRAISIERSRDIKLDGLRVRGVGLTGFGLVARWTQDLVVVDSEFTGLHTAIQLNEVINAQITRVRSIGNRSDGLNIAGSQIVTVDRILCDDTQPITEGPTPDHPDCVQLWSLKGKPPTADIVIRDSEARGATQGFSGFNPLDGGFDRVTVEGSFVQSSYPQGIGLYECRKCIVRGNVLATLPGAKYRTSINAIGGSTVVESSNSVAGR